VYDIVSLEGNDMPFNGFLDCVLQNMNILPLSTLAPIPWCSHCFCNYCAHAAPSNLRV